MSPVRDLVRYVLDHHRIRADLREEQLFAEWPRFVGEQVGARTRPDTIVDRTLIVEVATSTWLHELRLLRPKIVSDLLDKLGMPRFFDDIRFVLAGERKRTPRTTRPPSRPAAPAPREATPATGAAREQIARDVAAIADPELRDLVARVRVKHDR